MVRLIKDVGEIGLLGRIKSKIKLSRDVVAGIGDDAAVLKYGRKYHMLFTTDSLIENIHFKLKGIKPEQIGRKAVEINVSDIAAMGGFPKYMLVSLSMPRNTDVSFVDKLYKGINEAAKKYKISIVGGNLSRSKQINVHISLIGFVEKNLLCLRSNAKVGDIICVTGKLGKKARKEHIVRNYLEPKAQLAQGRILSRFVNAMQDVSDGLGSDLRAICRQSKVGAIIYKSKFSKSKNFDRWYMHVDYLELIFTIPKNKLNKLKKTNVKFSVIGEIKNKKEGIFMIDKNKKYKLKQGYDHFRSL
ncbi:thiamine-phosphate kinase [Candidatus Woesearchaeota archaeon]|jgi:thiamine-monophosphate kinase|nr:thiamine-phosphate kinase [Candidatus Woesearchaeota archaeon]MDP6648166.1 thiamine-phosphate kinase [Candidatus Woesearchaeota archaeon]|tara:strand:+ start:114270 stop:115175 length:906 start_codon:yes stop_codon:yes gene_type:complete